MSPIHVESSPSSPEIQTQQAPSPPQPVPQPQEAPADVLEQTADPADPIISSVVSSEQTSIAPPQGKVPTIKLSPVDLYFFYNYSYYFFSRHRSIGNSNRSTCGTNGINQPEA